VYNADVLAVIKRFRAVYEALAAKLPALFVAYRYASRGHDPHPNAQRKADQLCGWVKQLFSSAGIDFQFLGASSLLTLARRAPKATFSLRLTENPISCSGAVAFVCREPEGLLLLLHYRREGEPDPFHLRIELAKNSGG
jgi:hypothetical protein